MLLNRSVIMFMKSYGSCFKNGLMIVKLWKLITFYRLLDNSMGLLVINVGFVNVLSVRC